MEITVNELLEGKATIIKSKEYYSTKKYVQPFLDFMGTFTNDFRVKVQLPNQITFGDSQDLTYNRVLVEAVLPKENTIDGHDEVIGFVYGLDVRKPVAKFYRGYLNQACTNLTVFNAKWITTQELRPEESLKYDIKGLMEMASDFPTKLKALKAATLSKEDVFKKLGAWVDGALRNTQYNGIHNVKLSPNVPVEAYRNLFVDDKSEIYVPDTEEASMFDVYNAFTQILTDDKKDIMNKFEKTILVNQLLEV